MTPAQLRQKGREGFIQTGRLLFTTTVSRSEFLDLMDQLRDERTFYKLDSEADPVTLKFDHITVYAGER